MTRAQLIEENRLLIIEISKKFEELERLQDDIQYVKKLRVKKAKVSKPAFK